MEYRHLDVDPDLELKVKVFKFSDKWHLARQGDGWNWYDNGEWLSICLNGPRVREDSQWAFGPHELPEDPEDLDVTWCGSCSRMKIWKDFIPEAVQVKIERRKLLERLLEINQ